MIEQLTVFWQSQTSRLLLIYLAIIMAMSIGYSSIIYFVSVEQLERQLPEVIYEEVDGMIVVDHNFEKQIKQRVSEGKQELIIQLYILNLLMLVFGAALSYILARLTLRPIERNVEAQTRFVSDASHELKTPLTAIQTTNEVALRKKNLTIKQAKSLIEDNLDEVRRLQRMTGMLLELVSDDRRLLLTALPVHSVVSQAVTNVATAAIERKIVIDDQTKNYHILADEAAITQAVTILLDNAIKYSDSKTTITLTTTKPRRSIVRISVRDQGIGISKQEQLKIFDRFYRGDESRVRDHGNGGYGLGLEIAKNIAERHGGSIELQSKLGAGSTFSLSIPAAKVAKNRRKL